MGRGKVTIKQIADMAGVSIATVSHVINHTRYVSPDLVERVEQVIRETGYDARIAEKEKKIRTGRSSLIAGVFPDIDTSLYQEMAGYLNALAMEKGFQFALYLSGDDIRIEKQIFNRLLQDKSLSGVFLVPVGSDGADYQDLLSSNVPVVCVERSLPGLDVSSVEFMDRAGMQNGTKHLLESGHRRILYLREVFPGTARQERAEGFLEALQEADIDPYQANILDVDVVGEDQPCISAIEKALKRIKPTAAIASGSRLTRLLLQTVRNAGIAYPEEISILGYGDEKWTQLIDPPLTTLKRSAEEICRKAMGIMAGMIDTGNREAVKEYVDVALDIQKSTRMMESGRYGDPSVSADKIVLSDAEKKLIRRGRYRVAIAFHYTGTAWSELHEQGIRDEMEMYGIEVISVMDAHFDPELQIAQLESVKITQPDAVIAVPTDDRLMADAFMELSKSTKIVFLGSIPEGIGAGSYVSYISVNEWENGTTVGRLLGEYYRSEKEIRVGMIIHGAAFYGTSSRDQAAEKILREKYPQCTIVAKEHFSQIDNAFQVARRMLEEHPEIETLYVSWDQPALHVIRALREMGRTDVTVFTTDLDRDVALCMEEGIVKGLSTQRPYEQGRAAARAVAKSLIGQEPPRYIGVQPYTVKPDSLERAWKDIFHAEIPIEIEDLRK